MLNELPARGGVLGRVLINAGHWPNVRSWGEAEVDRQVEPAASVENDPSETLVEFPLGGS